MHEEIDVLILMGSRSDQEIMRKAEAELERYGVRWRTMIRSAHRMPEATVAAVKQAEEDGCQVFICAAGMAAHLAGVVASKTLRPVIGVPIASGALAGQDALLSTVMMPPGVPVATVAINGARNAALLAIQILAIQRSALAERLAEERRAQANA